MAIKKKEANKAFGAAFEIKTIEHPNYQEEFGHLEGYTIVGRHRKSAIITLVEHLTKCIIAIKPTGRQAANVETSLNQWLGQLPQHLFKPIIFDRGKEFSN